MVPLRIVKPGSPGGIAQAVAVGGTVQEVNHQSLLWRNHHFSDQDTDHQSVNLDVQFAPGYTV